MTTTPSITQDLHDLLTTPIVRGPQNWNVIVDDQAFEIQTPFDKHGIMLDEAKRQVRTLLEETAPQFETTHKLVSFRKVAG